MFHTRAIISVHNGAGLPHTGRRSRSAVLDAIKRGTSSIFWGDNQGNILNNGSMFFSIQASRFCRYSTARLRELSRAAPRDTGSRTRLPNRRMHFDPVSRLIAAGTDIDITTFHITAEELRASAG